ncbi:hypothetical protein NHQ30_007035 [Ciborinia camelliae]|nr:hypothetical protein NHQ30_007035 [Ciborinia camelliae]
MLPTGMASGYLKSITSQSLIGSHFGLPYFNESFDHDIVGGGTAGLTLATRLAENSSVSVAAIKAGGFSDFENGNISAIPAYNSYWIGKSPADRNPLIDWGIPIHRTNRNKWGNHSEVMPILLLKLSKQGFNGENMMYTQGKTLGGGSVRNSMAYQSSTIGTLQLVKFQPPEDLLRPLKAFPGPNISTDEDILTFLKKSSNTIYHASASNAMGNWTDPNAVVDSKSRFIGVDGLRQSEATKEM